MLCLIKEKESRVQRRGSNYDGQVYKTNKSKNSSPQKAEWIARTPAAAQNARNQSERSANPIKIKNV